MPSPGYIPGKLVIPATFQVRLLWQLPNSRAATNVLHAIVPDGLVNSQGLADALFGTIAGDGTTAGYFAFLSSQTALQAVDIRDLRTESQGLFQSTPGAVPGGGVANALPEEVALVCTLRSDLAGRAHRGRIYLTGFDASSIDAQGHAVAGLTLAAELWVNSALLGSFNFVGMTMAIAHRGHNAYVNKLGNTVPAEATGSDRVTQTIVRDNIFDSQRRRK